MAVAFIKLVVVAGPTAPAPVSVGPAVNSLTLGRAPDNTLVLPGPEISGIHCRLIRRGRHWLVQSLNDRAGTILNGQKVFRPAEIRSGDVLQIGDYHVQFVAESGFDEASAAPDPASQLTASVSARGNAIPSRSPAPTVAGGGGGRPSPGHAPTAPLAPAPLSHSGPGPGGIAAGSGMFASDLAFGRPARSSRTVTLAIMAGLCGLVGLIVVLALAAGPAGPSVSDGTSSAIGTGTSAVPAKGVPPPPPPGKPTTAHSTRLLDVLLEGAILHEAIGDSTSQPSAWALPQGKTLTVELEKQRHALVVAQPWQGVIKWNEVPPRLESTIGLAVRPQEPLSVGPHDIPAGTLLTRTATAWEIALPDK